MARYYSVIILAVILIASVCLPSHLYYVGRVAADPDGFIREAHYRIGKDTLLANMGWYSDTDIKTSGILREENFRVRFQFYNDGDITRSWLPRLEYLITGDSWTEVPDSPASLPFTITETGSFDNGDNISTSRFYLGTGTGTAQMGYAYSAAPAAAISLDAYSYTEIEFNIQANVYASSYTPYCFRITDNGTALDSYDNYAVISVWDEENTDSPHYGYGDLTGECASCHRLHTGNGEKLRIAWPEENLCNTCHDGTGARTDVASQFTVKNYTHPITASAGVHTTQEGGYNWLPAYDRHVECEDCHNPHGARYGASTPGFGDLSGTIQYTWGVVVDNPATAWAGLESVDYTRVTSVTAEYQLCFKCHSSYAYDTSPPLSHSGGITETDQSVEFNVNNTAYHWVETDQAAASGDTPRTDSESRDMTFTPGSGMEKDSPLGCSSCHASDTDSEARGVHGSNEPYLLRGTWSDTISGDSFDLCFQCHDEDVYGPGGSYTPGMTNFTGFYRRFNNTDPAPNLHVFHWTRPGVYGCQNCHSAVPHGGWNRAMLVENDDPAPYSNGSKLKVDNWAASGTWIWTDCYSSPCHFPGP